MNNTLLLLIIALKGVCLFICWKGVSYARRHQQNNQSTGDNLTDEEKQLINDKMNRLMNENKAMHEELKSMEINKKTS
ncbi:hypothetical protein QA612_07015 [Evansella sp. AB-P1]|uniref:hypothetical protein n=1 Tax=Evansella sp. AB-P1 TaxID=3037653 RepID=UPI00241E1E9A|nr:hypothetical protein [Evansella sp. AB-P1]MDG5787239.1 hypothetical protein [Evansella sp. AB-P1]